MPLHRDSCGVIHQRQSIMIYNERLAIFIYHVILPEWCKRLLRDLSGFFRDRHELNKYLLCGCEYALAYLVFATFLVAVS